MQPPLTSPSLRVGIFSCLSLYRKPYRRDMRWTLLLAALFGAIYGACVAPVASNILSHAQMLAGLVHYSPNPWASTLLHNHTLQTTLPALALHAQINSWSIALASSALFCAVSTMAMAATSYIVTRHPLLSLVIPLTLLNYHFTHDPNFPIAYPLGYFQLSQTGQYLALLALALATTGNLRISGIVGGALMAIDPLWSIGVLCGVFPVIGWLHLKRAERWCVYYAAAAIAALLLQHAALSALPAPVPYTPPIMSTATATPPAGKAAPTPVIRPLDSPAQPRLLDAPSPAHATYLFLLPTLSCLLLSAGLMFTQRRFPLCIHGSHARLFVYMAAIPIAVALLLKLLEELDPNQFLLTHIDYHLPALYTQAAPLRLLGITNLLAPLLAFSILITLARDAKSWAATACFILLLALSTRGWSLIPTLQHSTTLPPAAALLCFAMGCYLLCLCSFVPRPRIKAHHARATCLMVALLGYGSFTLVQLVLGVIHHQRFTGHETTTALVRIAKADTGQMLLAPGVEGAHNRFNPQLSTGRSVIPPVILEIPDPRSKTPIRVFCHAGTILPRMASPEAVRRCFEKRSASDWQVIAKTVPASGLITPGNWKIKLAKTSSSSGLTYYRLPR